MTGHEAPPSCGAFVCLDTESSAAHNLRVSSRSDGTRPPRIPVPGWIMSLMLLCVAVAGALLVYAVANRSLLGGRSGLAARTWGGSDRRQVQELEADVDRRVGRVVKEGRRRDLYGVLRAQHVQPGRLHHSHADVIDAACPQLANPGRCRGQRELARQVGAQPQIDLIATSRRAKAAAAPALFVYVHNGLNVTSPRGLASCSR